MREAGFEGFERGERGSTAQHLSVLDYKIQKDAETLTRIEKQVSAQQKQLASLSEKLTVERQASKTFHELDGLGRKTVFGKIELPENDYMEVIALAKEGIKSRGKIADLTQKLREARTMIDGLKLSYNNLFEQTKDFFHAIKLAPQRIKEVFAEIFAKDRENRDRNRTLHRSVKKRDEHER
ncbi:hypothetical protein SDC9_174750 [bioreactor metagenome]|uniref:Plasmid recombination enzyme n=1 Tax=bioreactor metagenome TaxID=1076179 RepID=A0A645GN44_9ZZZZ